MSPYSIGVDLGTTYTAAAIWKDGRAEAFSLGGRSLTIPSVLFLRDDGVFLVGDAAFKRGIGDPGRFAQEFKSSFGQRIGDRETPMLLGEAEYEPSALMSHLLRWVVEQVVKENGEPPDHVTLTCPATWGDYRRGLLREVAETAQLTSVGLLVEPVAAAVYYASQRRLATGDITAVYDLGGGTFDVTLVQKTADGFSILGTPLGTETIGGRNFDAAVMRLVEETVKKPWRAWDLDDPAVLAGLAAVRSGAVEAKELLSTDTEAYVSIQLPDLSRNVRVTRGEFESAIRLPVRQTIALLLQLLEDNELEQTDLASVLLVGGSSRIPLVGQLISSDIGVPVNVDAHPKYAVCLGAAISSSLRLAAPMRTDSGPPPPLPPLTVGEEPAGPPGNSGEDSAEAAMAGAELLAPESRHRPVLEVSVEEAGLLGPLDVRVEVHPELTAPQPVVSSVDESVRAHYGGVPSSGRRAAALVAAGVAVAVAAVAMVAGPLSGGLDVIPDGDPTTSASNTATQSENDVTLVPQEVAGSARAVMHDVARARDGLTIAVGTTTSRQPRPRVWTLQSGAWAALAPPTGVGGLNGVAIGSGSDHAIVAVGWKPAPTGDARVAAVWISSDGKSWEAVTAPPLQELFDVAAHSPGGYMATGIRTPSETADLGSVILTSTKGREWREQATRGLALPAPVTLVRLLPDADGGVTAVGTVQRSAVERSVLWTSPDGISWESGQVLLADEALAPRAWGLSQMPNGDLLVVGGGTTAEQPIVAVWTVAAGVPTYHPAQGAGGLFGVVRSARGFLVVGTAPDSSGADAAASWILESP